MATDKRASAPKLPHGCGSWVLVERDFTGAGLGTAKGEYFSRKNADKLARIIAANPDAAARYELLTCAAWLGRINGRIAS